MPPISLSREPQKTTMLCCGDACGSHAANESARSGNCVGTSVMSQRALAAAKRLEAAGVDAEVVDLRSLRPLDRPTIINSVKKTGRAVVLEEDWRSYGIGAEIAATIQEEAFDYLDAPVQRVAGVEVPLPYAAKLSQASKPGAQDLINAIRRALQGGKRWQK